jgi:N-acetylmuramic acid 6-phosphate etherase
VIDRSGLLTEQRLAESMSLDAMSIDQAVALMNSQDAIAVAAVGAERKNITAAVELVVAAFRRDGRLLYFGAGSSGRLGVLDASECPPTFRTDEQIVRGIIAGGDAAMFKAQEGAEDSAADGAAAVDRQTVSDRDVVMGIAAGGTTPFVHGALRRARQRGAKTIFLSCVRPVKDEPAVDVVIRPLTGPEVITGSTRLKAGTATKIVLNTISSVAMVQMGKVYENLMVDLRATNDKLRDRGARIVAVLTGLTPEKSVDLLKRADGHVKAAVVMHRRGIELPGARVILERCGGRLRDALA